MLSILPAFLGSGRRGIFTARTLPAGSRSERKPSSLVLKERFFTYKVRFCNDSLSLSVDDLTASIRDPWSEGGCITDVDGAEAFEEEEDDEDDEDDEDGEDEDEIEDDDEGRVGSGTFFSVKAIEDDGC